MKEKEPPGTARWLLNCPSSRATNQSTTFPRRHGPVRSVSDKLRPWVDGPRAEEGRPARSVSRATRTPAAEATVPARLSKERAQRSRWGPRPHPRSKHRVTEKKLEKGLRGTGQTGEKARGWVMFEKTERRPVSRRNGGGRWVRTRRVTVRLRAARLTQGSTQVASRLAGKVSPLPLEVQARPPPWQALSVPAALADMPGAWPSRPALVS